MCQRSRKKSQAIFHDSGLDATPLITESVSWGEIFVLSNE